jgi:hypothetical protein
MRFVVECVVCGRSVTTREEMDPARLEEAIELVDGVGCVCRACGGGVTVRTDGKVDAVR